MTTKTLLSAALACALFAPAASGHDHPHDHEPLHGGVVVEASDMDFELVAQANAIALHVRDHGKAASVQGATAKLTLLSGGEKSEVQLVPTADNSRLAAQGAFKVAAGTKVVAAVQLSGKKPVNVRFVLK